MAGENPSLEEPGLDLDLCGELIQVWVRDKGRVVFRKYWDSGISAEYETIYKWMGNYWPDDSTFGLTGPYYSLADALTADMAAITDATVSVTCSGLSAGRLVPHLKVITDSCLEIEINGQDWIVGDGKLGRSPRL